MGGGEISKKIREISLILCNKAPIFQRNLSVLSETPRNIGGSVLELYMEALSWSSGTLR
jgi:hypothetical protein